MSENTWRKTLKINLGQDQDIVELLLLEFQDNQCGFISITEMVDCNVDTQNKVHRMFALEWKGIPTKALILLVLKKQLIADILHIYYKKIFKFN